MWGCPECGASCPCTACTFMHQARPRGEKANPAPHLYSALPCPLAHTNPAERGRDGQGGGGHKRNMEGVGIEAEMEGNKTNSLFPQNQGPGEVRY